MFNKIFQSIVIVWVTFILAIIGWNYVCDGLTAASSLDNIIGFLSIIIEFLLFYGMVHTLNQIWSTK